LICLLSGKLKVGYVSDASHFSPMLTVKVERRYVGEKQFSSAALRAPQECLL